MIELSGKTILVTGGSRGIGEAIVRTVSAAGADVLLHYGKNRAAAEAIRGEIGGDTVDGLAHHVDLQWLVLAGSIDRERARLRAVVTGQQADPEALVLSVGSDGSAGHVRAVLDEIDPGRQLLARFDVHRIAVLGNLRVEHILAVKLLRQLHEIRRIQRRVSAIA